MMYGLAPEPENGMELKLVRVLSSDSELLKQDILIFSVGGGVPIKVLKYRIYEGIDR